MFAQLIQKFVVRVSHRMNFLYFLVHNIAQGVDVVAVGGTDEEGVQGVAAFCILRHAAIAVPTPTVLGN